MEQGRSYACPTVQGGMELAEAPVITPSSGFGTPNCLQSRVTGEWLIKTLGGEPLFPVALLRLGETRRAES